jgi:hypothetical protein
MTNKTSPIEKFNTEQVLGKSYNDEKYRPGQLSLDASGSYTVGQYAYPSDVTRSADLQHYVTFYVNVRGKTKFKPTTAVDVDVSGSSQNRGTSQSISTAAREGTGVLVGLSAAASALSKLNKVTSLSGAEVKKIISSSIKSGATVKGAQGLLAGKKVARGAIALGGAAAAGAATYGLTKAAISGLDNITNAFTVDTPRRIVDAIVLHMQTPPSVRYSVDYDKLDMGILGGLGEALAGGGSITDSLSSATGKESMALIGATAAGIPKVALASQLLGAPSPKDLLMAGGRVQTNPFRETIFKAINPREFEFKYTFLPKSEDEVYNIKRIIDLFKFHMHPELSEGKMFYVYPSEFDIVYYFSGAENKFINKISTCVLKDMSVVYGGDYFMSFKNGEPAEINLSLKFQELELLTKERIVKGY